MLILGMWAWSFFTPDHIKIECRQVLPVSKDLLFQQLRSLQAQSVLWTSIESMDVVKIKGVDEEIGAEMILESKEGRIKQRLSKIIEGERLESELWIPTFTGTNVSYLQFHSQGEDSTLLIWGIMGTHNFPSDVLARITGADALLEERMQSGLANIQADSLAS